MGIETIVGAGVAAYGAKKSSDAAKDGANQQAAGVAAGNALSQGQYNQTRQDNEQSRAMGGMANNMLATLLGIPDNRAFRQAYMDKLADVRAANPGISENWVPTDQSVFDYISANPSKYQTNQSDPNYGSLLRNFTQADWDADPISQKTMQYALDQGVQGLTRQASANGGRDSGALLKALQRNGANVAATYGNDAYNRFTNNQNSVYNKLAGVSGAGQQATNQITSAGQNYANTASNNLVGLGNARAASAIGSANAWNSAIGQGVNMWQQNRLMDRMYPQQG